MYSEPVPAPGVTWFQLLGSSDWLLPILLAQCILFLAWVVLLLRARTWRPFVLHAALCTAFVLVLYTVAQHTVAAYWASAASPCMLTPAKKELLRLLISRTVVGAPAAGLCVPVMLVLDAVAIARKPDSPPQSA